MSATTSIAVPRKLSFYLEYTNFRTLYVFAETPNKKRHSSEGN